MKKTYFVLMSLFFIIGIVSITTVSADTKSDILAFDTSEDARKTILLEIKSSQDINRIHNILHILIKETDSLDELEKQEWLDRLPVMRFQHTFTLLDIFSAEREGLATTPKENAITVTNMEEIKHIFSGKTIFWNDHKEYRRSDGVTFYNHKNMGLVTGKWFIKKHKICIQYIYTDHIYCNKVSKKGEQIFLNEQLITLKSGDTEHLQDIIPVGKIVTSAEDIKQIFSEKTIYQNKETEYTKADGVTFYHHKKKGIVTGTWFAKNEYICYHYTYSDDTFCLKVFKKGKDIFLNGDLITLISGDTENLQETFRLKSIK